MENIVALLVIIFILTLLVYAIRFIFAHIRTVVRGVPKNTDPPPPPLRIPELPIGVPLDGKEVVYFKNAVNRWTKEQAQWQTIPNGRAILQTGRKRVKRLCRVSNPPAIRPAGLISRRSRERFAK